MTILAYDVMLQLPFYAQIFRPYTPHENHWWGVGDECGASSPVLSFSRYHFGVLFSAQDSLGGTSACVAPFVSLSHQHGLYATWEAWMLMKIYVAVNGCYGKIGEALVM